MLLLPPVPPEVVIGVVIESGVVTDVVLTVRGVVIGADAVLIVSSKIVIVTMPISP